MTRRKKYLASSKALRQQGFFIFWQRCFKKTKYNFLSPFLTFSHLYSKSIGVSRNPEASDGGALLIGRRKENEFVDEWAAWMV